MSKTFNRAILEGYLCGGKGAPRMIAAKCLRFRLKAYERRCDPATGEWGNAPVYFTVMYRGDQAPAEAQRLKPTMHVIVEGRIKPKSWRGKDGLEHETVEIEASSITYLAGGSGRNGGAEGEDSPQQDYPSTLCELEEGEVPF